MRLGIGGLLRTFFITFWILSCKNSSHFVSGDIVKISTGEYAFVLLLKKHTNYSAILAPSHLNEKEELVLANLKNAFFYDSPKDIGITAKKIDG